MNKKLQIKEVKMRKSLFIFTIIALIAGIILIIGCSNKATENTNMEKQHRNDGVKRYEVTIHEYILLEYLNNYSDRHWDEIFRANPQLYKENGEIDEQVASRFFVQNIHMFSDSELWDSVVQKALIKYGVKIDGDTRSLGAIENPFSMDAIMQYMDVDNQYGGYNFVTASDDELFSEITRFYTQDLKPYLSSAESAHFENLLSLIEKEESLDGLISFFESSKNDTNLSQEYRDTFDFAQNLFAFYDSGDLVDANALPGIIDYIAAIGTCKLFGYPLCPMTDHSLCRAGGSYVSEIAVKIIKWFKKIF